MKKITLLAIFCCFGLLAFAQQGGRFDKEIMDFVQQDKADFPMKGGVVFTGSSSIRMWKDLKERFEGYHIIQRGFGGSQFSDLIHYADQIVFPYRPSKLFVYEGDNDLASGKSPDQVIREFLIFYRMMQEKLPETKIYFIAAKPSVSRQKLLPAYTELHNKMTALCKMHPEDLVYVDVFTPMLDPEGMPLTDIFLEDNLHMNSKGYDIWEKVIAEYL